jgi:outer membrane protein assembly factor BamB
MKTILISFLLVAMAGIYQATAQQLQKVWEASEGLKTPESVLYDELNDVIYVANINENPSEKDGNGFISILNPDGTTKTLEWVKKLNAPKGMAIYEGKLYVADIDQLVEIDIEKGKISKKYDAPGAVFLNDVTVCMNGMVFVSDTRTAKIHVLHQGEFKVWMEGEPFKSPNGLMAEKGKLYVGDENIYEVDILTQKVNLIVEDAGGVDGLEKNNSGQYIFSNWPGKIFLNKDGENIKLLDSTEQSINTADIDFAHKYDLILVPTFFNNRVVAYKIVN